MSDLKQKLSRFRQKQSRAEIVGDMAEFILPTQLPPLVWAVLALRFRRGPVFYRLPSQKSGLLRTFKEHLPRKLADEKRFLP